MRTTEHDTLRLAALGLDAGDIRALRRASRALQRWSELECGDSDAYASRVIERDEATGRPYLMVSPHRGTAYRVPTRDAEASALRAVRAVCERRGLRYYHQTDPRGCALYVSVEPLTAATYYGAGVPVL